MTRDEPEIPNKLHKVYRRSRPWPSLHAGRVPIPEPLWAAAAEVAPEQEIFPTAKALRLQYGKLKRWVEAVLPAATRRVAKASSADRAQVLLVPV
jgi:hypothetical protein